MFFFWEGGRGVGNKDRRIVGEKLLASESLWLLGSNLLFGAVRVAREVIYCFVQSAAESDRLK